MKKWKKYLLIILIEKNEKMNIIKYLIDKNY